MLRKPIAEMGAHINQIKSEQLGTELDDDEMTKTKFMIYSAHDDQIDNSMVWLMQSMSSFDHIPYASTVIYELKYSQTCLDQATDSLDDCFGVSVAFNGTPLKFYGCSGDGFTEFRTGCTWKEFNDYMATIWYSGPDADNLNEACYNAYVPS